MNTKSIYNMYIHPFSVNAQYNTQQFEQEFIQILDKIDNIRTTNDYIEKEINYIYKKLLIYYNRKQHKKSYIHNTR